MEHTFTSVLRHLTDRVSIPEELLLEQWLAFRIVNLPDNRPKNPFYTWLRQTPSTPTSSHPGAYPAVGLFLTEIRDVSSLAEKWYTKNQKQFSMLEDHWELLYGIYTTLFFSKSHNRNSDKTPIIPIPIQLDNSAGFILTTRTGTLVPSEISAPVGPQEKLLIPLSAAIKNDLAFHSSFLQNIWSMPNSALLESGLYFSLFCTTGPFRTLELIKDSIPSDAYKTRRTGSLLYKGINPYQNVLIRANCINAMLGFFTKQLNKYQSLAQALPQ